jgi:hypothetical protein
MALMPFQFKADVIWMCRITKGNFDGIVVPQNHSALSTCFEQGDWFLTIKACVNVSRVPHGLVVKHNDPTIWMSHNHTLKLGDVPLIKVHVGDCVSSKCGKHILVPILDMRPYRQSYIVFLAFPGMLPVPIVLDNVDCCLVHRH